MAKKYLLGLDLGTDSVGWALTDEDYNVIKKKGKSLWGVRLFEGAKTNQDRRNQRSERRRLQRRKERISLLRSLFEEEMQTIDPTFFQRLDEAQFYFEDKRAKFNYLLFNDRNYTDKDFFHQFPTIYHLRKHLLESNKKEDLRFIFLVFSHMVKYRGHFLFEGQEFKLSNTNLLEYFENINTLLHDCLPEDEDCINVDEEKIVAIENFYKERKNITESKEFLQKTLDSSSKNIKKILKTTIIPLISGGQIDIKKVLEKDDFDEIKQISCSSENFVEDIEKLKTFFPEKEELLEIINICKKIYDSLILLSILKGNKNISESMIDSYERHKSDLKKLKIYIKTYHKEKYNEVFRIVKKPDEKGKLKYFSNYVNYIGKTNSKNNSINLPRCSKSDFYKYLKGILGIAKVKEQDIQNEVLKEIYNKIENNSYLERQNNTNNSVLPYQLNLMEMEEIINKQSEFYPFLKKQDEYGTIGDKIKSILTFKIPYYVGPLNTHSNFSWIERKKEKIFPWNFKDIVDLNKSAEEFITRMQNKCQYLDDCYCLPKDSIIFSYYCVLSELNIIHLNGRKLSQEMKNDLITEIYLKNRKVTKKKLTSYLKNKYGTNIQITTSNDKDLEELHSSLSSLYDFSAIFGFNYVKENIQLIEKIIKDIVIFEDKKILEDRLKKSYQIKDTQIINKIKSLQYKKYGRLSKELLMDLPAISTDGEVLNTNILTLMEETGKTLNEILYDSNYNFKKSIENFNHKKFSIKGNSIEDVTEFIQNSYASPGMKRSIIQAYNIIEELEQIIQHPIDEFYIECNRNNSNEKKRTISRYENMKNLLKQAAEFSTNSLKEEILYCQKLLKNYESDPKKLNIERIYLYFTQLGKCVYTGQTISLSDLLTTDKYDVDHIYPRSKIKDDSLDNKVLVVSTANKDKGDTYPYLLGVERIKYIEELHNRKLISDKKFHRLISKEELSDAEIGNFIERQLVFTSQSVKALAKVLNEFKKDKLIVLSKAENVSNFRKNMDILKCREANNYHHAHDAYLNIVVGRMMHYYFGVSFLSPHIQIDKLHKEGKTTNIDKIFEDNEKKNRKPIFDTNKNIIWNYQSTLPKIKNQILNRFDILTTTRTYFKTKLFSEISLTNAKDCENGTFTLARKNPKNTNNSLYPLTNTSKYGGYKSLSYGSYMLIEAKDEKGNSFFTLETIPTLIQKNMKKEEINEFLKNECGLKEPKIVLSNLKINTVIQSGKSKYCITGKTNNYFLIKNLRESNYSYDAILIIRKIVKLYTILESEKIIYKGVINNDLLVKKYGEKINKEKVIISPAKNEKAEEISLTLEECQKLFNIFKQQLKSCIFEDFSNIEKILDQLEKIDEKIRNLQIFEYVVLLNELLKLTNCNSSTSNLKIIDLKEQSGKLTIRKIINKKIKIIYESVTGFYTKVIWSN